MYRELIIYEWPTSQICMDCKNGTFVTIGNDDTGSQYSCDKKCKENDGSNCPERKEKEEKDDES